MNLQENKALLFSDFFFLIASAQKRIYFYIFDPLLEIYSDRISSNGLSVWLNKCLTPSAILNIPLCNQSWALG